MFHKTIKEVFLYLFLPQFVMLWYWAVIDTIMISFLYTSKFKLLMVTGNMPTGKKPTGKMPTKQSPQEKCPQEKKAYL